MGIVFALLILAPLVGSAINGLMLRSPQPRRSGVIATLASGTSFVCAVLLSLNLPVHITTEWFQAGSLRVDWGFTFDQLTAVMALVVTGIGTLIHLYSIGYMSEERTPYRYFAYLNLFLFNMLVLICADNLPVLFVGWEGVGLCSYLLIGYWYQDPEKAKAGMKAFLVNRIGDAGFLLGMFLCFQLLGSLRFADMAPAVSSLEMGNLYALNVAAFLFFVGATGKSAQIPLFVWLPDAMAGPTPVSALIHAATMVTAGIYLIVRMNFLFQVTGDTNQIIASIGIATALFAALIATSQRDIKKVLAYSTVSQLGLMFVALGVQAYVAAIFHVLTHAFFKACLFLGSGSVIHALEGEQDISKMGGLKRSLPKTYLTFAIATAAICGIPPLSGFFSKDTILFAALAQSKALYLLGLAVSFLTAFYMCRLFSLTFLGSFRGHEGQHPHESPAVMTIPLLFLAAGSALTGFLGLPHDLHLLPNYLVEFLGPVIAAQPEAHPSLGEIPAMGIATLVAVSGSLLGLKFPGVSLPLKPVLENKFYVDELYHYLIVVPLRALSRVLAKIVDPYLIDGAVLFPTRVARAGATVLSFVQVGSAQFYLLVMLIGALGVLWFGMKGVLL